MVAIKRKSWHYHVISKYAGKDIYTGMSFCQYTRWVMLGLLSIVGIIVLVSFLLIGSVIGLPLLLTGQFSELIPFYSGYLFIDSPKTALDAIIGASMVINGGMVVVGCVCLMYHGLIKLIEYLAIFAYSVYLYFKGHDPKSTESKPESPRVKYSLIGQWIKFKYEKICPTITVES